MIKMRSCSYAWICHPITPGDMRWESAHFRPAHKGVVRLVPTHVLSEKMFWFLYVSDRQQEGWCVCTEVDDSLKMHWWVGCSWWRSLDDVEWRYRILTHSFKHEGQGIILRLRGYKWVWVVRLVSCRSDLSNSRITERMKVMCLIKNIESRNEHLNLLRQMPSVR